MQRTTITLDDDLDAMLDAYMEATGAQSRSEAIRDLVRRGLTARPDAPPEAACYGVISCVVDHSVRNLGARLPQTRLDRHDQTVASLSTPIDHTHSLEVTVLRSQVGPVIAYAESLFLQRGVWHGALGLVPLGEDEEPHRHGDNHGENAAHSHPRVLSGF